MLPLSDVASTRNTHVHLLALRASVWDDFDERKHKLEAAKRVNPFSSRGVLSGPSLLIVIRSLTGEPLLASRADGNAQTGRSFLPLFPLAGRSVRYLLKWKLFERVMFVRLDHHIGIDARVFAGDVFP